MTIVKLEFTAELVKIIDLRPADNFEADALLYFPKVICLGCEDSNANRNAISIYPSQLYKVNYKNKYMQVHAFTKCHGCQTLGIIQLRPDLGNYSTLTAELSRAGKYATLTHLNFDGLKANNQCSLTGKFVAKTEDNREITVSIYRGQDFVENNKTGVAVRNLKLGFSIVESSASAGQKTCH